MKNLSAAEIRGTWASLLLPINADDSIDYGRLREEIRVVAASGVPGIYSNGSAGEFHTQTEAEFDRVNAILAEECEQLGLAYQIGVCHMSAQLSLERLRRTVDWRPGAVQVILPDWFAPRRDEAVAFLARMAEAAGPIGLIVYNPLHAKRVFTPSDWIAVARQVPSIVGIKVAGGDAGWYQQMQPLLRRIAVFVPGHTLATGYARGATGSYSNVACLSPAGAERWFQLMLTDPARALEWEARIQAFIKGRIVPFITEQGFTNTAVDKLLAAIGGWSDLGTRLRWPYRSIPETEVPRLRALALAELPEVMQA